MNSASKVGEIFLAAGNAYSQLGEAIMSLHPSAVQMDSVNVTSTTTTTNTTTSNTNNIITTSSSESSDNDNINNILPGIINVRKSKKCPFLFTDSLSPFSDVNMMLNHQDGVSVNTN